MILHSDENAPDEGRAPAPQEESLHRPKGTFERVKIEFRSVSEEVTVFGNSKKLPAPIPYAYRADRISKILLGLTAISLLVMAGAMMFGPGSKYSIKHSLQSVQSPATAPNDDEAEDDETATDDETAVDDAAISKNLETKIELLRKARAQKALADASANNSDQKVQDFSKGQQSFLNKKADQISAKKHQKIALLDDSPAWKEPAKLDSLHLPVRIYDDLGQPVPEDAFKQTVPAPR